MTDYKTMRVPEDAWEDAKERKEQHGMTWGEWMRQATVEDVSTNADDVSSVDYDDVKSACRAAIRDELPVEQMGGR